MNDNSYLGDLIAFDKSTGSLDVDDSVLFQLEDFQVEEVNIANVMKNILISWFLIICVFSCGSSISVAQETNEVVPAAERLNDYLPKLSGKRVGLVVNHASLVGNIHLVDALLGAEVDVRRIFAPEHGFRGEADAGSKIDDGIDEATGLRIVSLYGKNRKPTEDQLEGLDVVVFDLQDVGVRFYTYISTLHLVMEACSENNVQVLVLDRPNPNGYYVDGPLLEKEYKSFIGMHPIPIVYGLTIGELATMINGEGWLAGGENCDLEVVTCLNYDHTMTCDLPVKPSPNLPNLRSILLYPSLCLFEGTTVSIGRGTNDQFQVIGHPDASFGSYVFTPVSMPGATNPKHENVQLNGTNLTGLNVDDIMSWKRLNLAWLIGYYEMVSQRDQFFLENNFFDKLAGTEKLRQQILDGKSEEQIRESWQKDLAAYKSKRIKYLLYPDFE